MAIQPMALAVQNPEINAVQAMSEGVNARQQMESNNLTLAKQSLQNIGSMAFGVMGGKIDGQADPQMWEQSLDMLAGSGMNVDAFRGRPDLAPIVARASVDTLGQLNLAQNERELEQRLQEFAFKVSEAAKGPKTSLNLSYGQDAQGNVVPLQTRDDGTMVQSQLPEGVTLATKSDKIDLGTHWGILDPLTRQVVDRVPKENFQEAYDTASGTARGKADVENTMGAPAAVASAENSLAMIDAVINDPNLEQAIGLGGILPAIPGTPQAGVVARIEQLQGSAFLQAFESLKGGGQITEVEGKKATDAIARLSRVQNKADFVAALNDLKSVIALGLERARSQQSAPASAAPAQAAPASPTRLVWNPDTGELE